ncbi:ComEC/Rec2 family competence protein [Solirhodobacter olei]|uniref:ComEC/Rec2 family competence protein n=1 Tax=Solirhodobacter olei TaxID=2493082 RepID=UPI000FD8EA18|nr:ComEC/Rec2 family competence protein [Solirhodobacter olei]
MALVGPLEALAAQRGHLFLWAPVFLALGIGGYFGLPVEPGAAVLGGVGAASTAFFLLGWRAGERWRPLAAALALALLGFEAAAFRAHWVAAPVLPFRYYGPVEGRVVALDRSASDHPRVTVDRLRLQRVARGEVPGRARLTLLGSAPGAAVRPGAVVATLGFLGPPQGPAEPGGFDFQRYAWFDGLGAVGYGRKPLRVLAPAPGGADLAFARLRQRIAAAVRARIPGDAGGFVAAILTNDKSGLSQASLDHLRVANLAHMLAISGLHMALVTGFVFSALRYGLALIPPLALRLPVKKIAASVALVAAAFYLMLSGAAVATERSFVMVSVMLVAVLFDRRAITLRSVAISAVILLLIQPECLTEAGFQMSYAATVALVAVFAALTRRGGAWPLRGWVAPVGVLALSSLVAGLATAPFAAAYFGRLSAYGLAANLAAMPVMAGVEMPGAVVAGLLAPLGLEGPVLWVVGQGARWILGVAATLAGLPGAAVPVAAPPWQVLPMLALGALVLILWQGRARVLGLGLAIAALVLWARAERPVLLIAQSGGLVGVMGPGGRVLSKPVEGFVAHAWLQADGDAAGAEAASARRGFSGPGAARAFEVAGRPAVVLTGKSAAGALAGACHTAALVVSPARAGRAHLPGGCVLLDGWVLRRSGALALRRQDGRLVFVSARAVQGDRLWTRAGHRYPLRVPEIPPIEGKTQLAAR